MWILENEGDALEGKRLWLRPGKTYLFGRTVAEPGMLAIRGEKSSTISRKHVTITVDGVKQGDGQNVASRSKVTVTDLKSKLGTTVNGQLLKGDSVILTADENELLMGSFRPHFRISWFPVVLSFTFNKKELQADAENRIRKRLEHLDIKFMTDFSIRNTTHVVSKKRNTPKGLQGLITGRYVVDDRFIDAITDAATPKQLEDGMETSSLEGDFDAKWPDPMQFVPPPANEPRPRPSEFFAPDPARADVFDGYTFIYYNPDQYNSLLEVITTGKGKALLKEVIPYTMQVDEFVRYVKGIAGECGHGNFEDGSDGMGVVVIRFVPENAETSAWFNQFHTAVSQRLDHRMIDQKDFMEAILVKNATILRRSLLEPSQQALPQPASAPARPEQLMEVDEQQPSARSEPVISKTRRRVRGGTKSRFKGFDMGDDSDDDDQGESAPAALATGAGAGESSQEGLFVSQESAVEMAESAPAGRRSQHKRQFEEPDVMEEFAPNAALAKRRRIERGESAVPRQSSPTASGTQVSAAKSAASKQAKARKELDILEEARKHREEAQAAALAEREELAHVPEGLDLAEIRRLQIEEPMEVRQPPEIRTRAADIADGRWDPKWNGRRNFKRFVPRGTPNAVRQPMAIIVPLAEVKNKGFGIGDDYWLEEEGSQRKKKNHSQIQSQSQLAGNGDSAEQGRTGHKSGSRSQAALQAVGADDSLPDIDAIARDVVEDNDVDDEDDDDDDDVVVSTSRSRASRAAATASAATQSQRTQSARTATKRAAAAPPAKQQPAKKAKIVAVPDSDDESEDELRFRFTKRK